MDWVSLRWLALLGRTLGWVALRRIALGRLAVVWLPVRRLPLGRVWSARRILVWRAADLGWRRRHWRTGVLARRRRGLLLWLGRRAWLWRRGRGPCILWGRWPSCAGRSLCETRGRGRYGRRGWRVVGRRRAGLLAGNDRGLLCEHALQYREEVEDGGFLTPQISKYVPWSHVKSNPHPKRSTSQQDTDGRPAPADPRAAPDAPP